MAIQIQNIPFYPIELEKPLVDSSIDWTSQPNLIFKTLIFSLNNANFVILYHAT